EHARRLATKRRGRLGADGALGECIDGLGAAEGKSGACDMRRYISAFAILWIAVVPVSVMPTRLIVALAIATGLFCIAGLLWRSLGATLAGCVLAVLALALALWWGAASMSVFGAIAFGLAVLVLLDATDFARRFAGAQVVD